EQAMKEINDIKDTELSKGLSEGMRIGSSVALRNVEGMIDGLVVKLNKLEYDEPSRTKKTFHAGCSSSLTELNKALKEINYGQLGEPLVIPTADTAVISEQSSSLSADIILQDELDNQFPKGDKARGKALVLVALANMEIEKIKAETIQELYNNEIEFLQDVLVHHPNDVMYFLKKRLEKIEELRNHSPHPVLKQDGANECSIVHSDVDTQEGKDKSVTEKMLLSPNLAEQVESRPLDKNREVIK
ncbi:MAG: hypothetical protein WD512_03760, partial [Candidatus Paceibacterota bacterium]